MKKVAITLKLVLLVCIAIAQSTPTDEKVKNLIQEGRNDIIKEITEDNPGGALSTLSALKKSVGEKYIVLYPREELMVAFATRNFEYFADSARSYNSALSDKRKGFIYKDFRDELHLYMLPEIMNISRELEESKLPEIDKEIARIYVHYLFNDDISALNELINKFEREHSRSLFAMFLNSLKRLTLKSRLNFSIGHSGEFIGGKVRDNYYNVLTLTKIELDGFIRKTYFSLFIGGGFTDINLTYLREDNNGDIEAIGEDKASSLKYGLKFGRVIYSTQTVKMYPYLSIGGYEISPSSLLYETDYVIKLSEIKTGAFFGGAGISADVILKRWKPKQMYDPKGYFFIRPNLGYDRFLTGEKIYNSNNFYFSVSLGVSIGAQ